MAAEDVIEIQNLLYSYSWEIDSGDFDAICRQMKNADIYANGKRIVHCNSAKYRKYFLDNIILYEDGTPKTSHMCVNPVITVAEDGLTAKAKSYTVVCQGVTGEFTPRIVWIDRKYDTFKKVDGCWQFASREFRTISEGDTSRHLK